MSYQAGSAFISIKPDMSSFQGDVKEQLSETDAQFEKGGESAGQKFSSGFQDELKASFANLPDATVKASADTAKLTADLDAAAAARTVEFTADADTAAANAAFDHMALNRPGPTFTPKADTTAAEAQLTGLTKDRKTTVDADADTAKAETELDALVNKKRTAKVSVSIDKDGLKSLALPAALISGISAIGPAAAGAALGIAGIGTGLVAAGVTAVGFGVVAKGMFADVTNAQKLLTKAQDDYNSATTSAGRATALQEEKEATDGLSASDKTLLSEMTDLQNAYGTLLDAEQPLVGSALTPWLQTATSSMQLLAPVIGDGAGAIQLLGDEAQKALAAPFWGTFFNTLGTTGQIAMVNFGQAIGSVGDGLAHLFVTFAPDIDNLLPLVDKAATAFDTWAKSVTAGGLESFFATTFSPANVAMLKTDLGDIATVAENLAKAAGQLSPTAFSGLSNLLDVLAKLTPGQIEALATLYGVSKTVGGIGNLSKALTTLPTLTLPTIKKKTTTSPAEPKEKAPNAIPIGGIVAGATIVQQGVKAASNFVSKPGTSQGKAAKDINQGQQKLTGLPGGGGSGSPLDLASGFEGWATTTLPEIWSKAYQGFETEIGSPIAAWFTNSLPNFFTNAIPQDIWSPAYEGFQSDFAGPLTGFFTNVLPGFFTSTIPALFSGAGSWLAGAGSAISGGLVSAWNASSGAVTAAFGAAEGWVTGAFGAAVSWLSATGSTIEGGLVTAWNATSGAVTAAFGAAETWVTGAFASAVSWLSATGTSIEGGLVAAWNATSGAVTTAFGAAKTWVTGVFADAASWLTTAGKSAESGLVSAWNATSGAVTTAFAAAKTWATGAVADAASWLTTAGKNAESGLVTAWNATKGTATSAFAAAKTWVTGAFSDASSWLTSAGANAVQGFINGLQSKSSDLIAEAESLASSVTSKIESALSISSPSKVTHQLGVYTGQGFTGGLASQVPMAGAAAGSLAMASAKGLASVAGAQSLSSLGSLRVPTISAAPRLPGVTSSLGAGRLSLNVNYTGPSGGAIEAIISDLRYSIQGQSGGDVQGHLGQGPVRVP